MDINNCPICGKPPTRLASRDFFLVICRYKDEHSTHEVSTRPFISQDAADKAWIAGDVSWNYGMYGVSAYQQFDLTGGLDNITIGWSSFGSVSISNARDFRNRFTIVLAMAEHMIVATSEESE